MPDAAFFFLAAPHLASGPCRWRVLPKQHLARKLQVNYQHFLLWPRLLGYHPYIFALSGRLRSSAIFMRRPGFSLLIVLLLAACSGAPQKTVRGPSTSSSASAAGAYRTMPPAFPNFVDHSIGREEISIQAMSLVGVPYRWGGNTPDSGFDCSGLVRYVVLRAASVNLPRTTADMSGRGESIEPDEIAPGDLIFFNTTGRPHSHVGIYVGKLRFVNAPSTGGTVRLDYLTNPYWAKRFDGIRRVAAPDGKPAPFDTPAYQASTAPEKIAPAGQRGSVPVYAADSSAGGSTQAQPADARLVATAPARAPRSAIAPVTSAAPAPPAATASADPFEPPPRGMNAAQMQARAAGAVAPVAAPGGRTQPDSGTFASTRSAGPAARLESPAAAPATRAADASSPVDAIDAAADAFEPPPPAAIAARQARLAQQAQPQSGNANEVQIMRASTASRPTAAPTQTGDDPIARFANGSF